VTGPEAPTAERRASAGWRVAGAFVRRREASIFVVAVLLCIYFSARSAAFYSGDNAKNIAETMAPIALIAAGEVMLLICGEIDLAVGRVYALAPAIVYVVSSEEQHGYPIWVGFAAALAVAACVGLTNGVVTTFLRVPSFITTLGMLFLLNGITLHLLEGTQVFMPGGDTFQDIFGSQPFEYAAYFNSTFWWALGLILILQFVLTWTRWGLHTIATGGNLIGAAESGVNVRAIKIGNFVLANLLAGFAGILDSTRVTTIVPLQGGPDLMFLAVAGAVIGGTSLFGGRGHIKSALLGALVISSIDNGLGLLGLGSGEKFVITGGVLLLAVTVDSVSRRKQTQTGRL
jgi:simple sugar transport system permease protein